MDQDGVIPSIDQLDPDARVMRDAWRSAGIPPLHSLTPPDARRLLAELQRGRVTTPRPVARVADLSCPGADAPNALRLYHPRPGTRRPAIIFFHGGGWVLNDLESHDALCRTIAVEADVAVLAVDYRLAPEHPYPAALEDASSAIAFLAAHADELNLDATQVIVAGDSAGGTLATTIAMPGSQVSNVAIQLLLLFYPVLDLDFRSASHALDDDGLAVTGKTMRWFRDHYLGAQAGSLDWKMSPAAASSYVGLPPCYLVSAGVDPLRDEAFEFAFRLAVDGVPVIHDHNPGQAHGFLTALLDGSTAQRVIARSAQVIRHILDDKV